MVFSSVPLYLDPPNWQQLPNQQLEGGSIGGGNGNEEVKNIQGGVVVGHHDHPPNNQVQGGATAQPGGIRPNSMAERARLAKMAPPEAPLKCPRCESSNTKFCYFNNYNLSQPRHFCKTCRRYWTRGGALRNVPVGGGCRRNKRSSSKCSTSTTTSAANSKSSSSSTAGDFFSSSTSGNIIPSGTGMSSFMASLAHLNMGNLGLTFGGSLQALGGGGGFDHHQNNPHLDFNGAHTSVLSNHQAISLPPNFLGGFQVPDSDQQTGVGGGGDVVQIASSKGPSVVMSNSKFAPAKMEEYGNGGLGLAKQLMGMSSADYKKDGTASQFWSVNMGNNTTNMWTHLSGFNSTTTSHLL